MPTIRDVAKKAGVAPITVSRVINNSGYVSADTRKKVQTAIDNLGYVPNMVGRSLRINKTMILAAVVTDITNPFWTSVTRGIEDIAQANGYSTILCNTDESEIKQESYIRMLLQQQVDGILFVPAINDPSLIKKVQQRGVPIVLMDRHIEGIEVDIVRTDSETGAYRLADHLFSMGHRRITLLAGPKNVPTAVDRVNGFLSALDDACLEGCLAQVLWGRFSKESGYEMAKKAMEIQPKLTALFTGNNFIALGALTYLKEAGYQVPEDVAIVTFSGTDSPFVQEPFFTTDINPDMEMGRQAAQLLVDRMQGKTGAEYKQVVLSTETHIRGSSGGPLTS